MTPPPDKPTKTPFTSNRQAKKWGKVRDSARLERENDALSTTIQLQADHTESVDDESDLPLDSLETSQPRQSKRGKAPHDMAGAENLPTREAITEFVARQTTKVGKREIAKAFGIKGGARIALKRLLQEMADQGQFEKRGKRLHKAGTLPPVLLCDITSRDRDGDLWATPVEWDTDLSGAAPLIRLTIPRKQRPGEPTAAVKDRALLRLWNDGGDTYSGRVIKLIERARHQALGVFRANKDGHGGGIIEPIDKKSLGRILRVNPGDDDGAKDGDLVSASLGPTPRLGPPLARIKERLGSITSEKAISLIALEAHGIPTRFAPATLEEAEAAIPSSLKGREDWRDIVLLTIDPPDAKDHDDAVFAEADTDPANAGGYVVTVAIADVAAYVRFGSSMDREAGERGNSVYFPDRVVPMLPERISNNLCSLRPLEDRPALAVRMVLGADGHKRRQSFHRIMMRSAAKLSYQQAQDAIDGRTVDTTAPLLAPVLMPLWEAYRIATKARTERAPLALDLPERKIILKSDGSVDRVHIPPRLDAHKLIEEFMILANVAAAEMLESKRMPLLYRVHGEPSMEKMRSLGEVLATVGIKITLQGALRPAFFNKILSQVENSEHQAFVNDLVLRCQAQAEYSRDNIGHFGLNLHRYAHFTSPIRRYADLIVHRALIRAFGLGDDGLADAQIGELAAIATTISAAERRAMGAERETIDRLIAFHLSEHVGATFSGRVAGVTRSGLFVKLEDTGADGFIPAATLGGDYYAFDEGAHALIGQGTGESWRLGDTVSVKLVEAAPVAGALRFEMLSEGRIIKGRGAGKRGMRRETGRAKAHLPQRQRQTRRKARP